MLLYHVTVNVFGSAIERRQHDTEFILYTGRIPPTWLRRRPSAGPGIIWARWRAVRRLSRLIGYYRHTPLVDSESRREATLEGLRDARAGWRSEPWDQIILPSSQ